MDIHEELNKLEAAINKLEEYCLGKAAKPYADEGRKIIKKFKKTFPKQTRKLYWNPEEPEDGADSAEDLFFKNYNLSEKNPSEEITFDVAYVANQETYLFEEDFSKEEDDENRVKITLKD